MMPRNSRRSVRLRRLRRTVPPSLRLSILALSLTLAGATPVAAQCSATETFKVTGSGASQDDFAGAAVAVGGNLAVVGAAREEPGGVGSGAVYVFDTATGVELATCIPSDGADDDFFGESVDIDDGIVIVAAPASDALGLNSGAAYLFDALTGVELRQLLPDDGKAGDRFGTSVAIAGNRAIVGASRDDDEGGTGSAYIFDVATGNQLHKLYPSDGAADDYFGISAAIGGSNGSQLALVGASLHNGLGPFSGAVYVYDANTGVELRKLTPNDGATGDEFGFDVAIDGNVACIGAYYHDANGLDSGAVYLFDVTTGTQTRKLLASDGAANDALGYAVDIDDNVVIAGAYKFEDPESVAGAVYLFNAATGNELDKLAASDIVLNDGFGGAVGISGSDAICGARNDDEFGNQSGAAYLYTHDCPPPCPTDLDNDGVTSFGDLIEVLVDWGPCSGCIGDVDGNGINNFNDVLQILTAWGPCP